MDLFTKDTHSEVFFLLPPLFNFYLLFLWLFCATDYSGTKFHLTELQQFYKLCNLGSNSSVIVNIQPILWETKEK